LLGIDLLDHLVVADHGWTSMARRGQLAPDKGFQQALYTQRYADALGPLPGAIAAANPTTPARPARNDAATPRRGVTP